MAWFDFHLRGRSASQTDSLFVLNIKCVPCPFPNSYLRWLHTDSKHQFSCNSAMALNNQVLKNRSKNQVSSANVDTSLKESCKPSTHAELLLHTLSSMIRNVHTWPSAPKAAHYKVWSVAGLVIHSRHWRIMQMEFPKYTTNCLNCEKALSWNFQQLPETVYSDKMAYLLIS